MIKLQEHERLIDITEQVERYDNLSLISWDRPMDGNPWGYYASYKIGAEWVDSKEVLVVTTKRGMENIDFLDMFMTCFSSNLAIESFSDIYRIEAEQPTIAAPALVGVVSPLIVLHFIGVVSRIKAVKRGYVHREDNLKKVKGHIQVLKNERKNVVSKRFDRVFCCYDEYSIDIPENRLIKKALLFSKKLLHNIGDSHHSYNKIKIMLKKSLTLFEDVSDEVEIREVGQIKGHKLFKEYAEAVRLAKMVLMHFDFSISKVSQKEEQITPFVLDMSLLYEHYVYGLLFEAYHEKIAYQYKGRTGCPDFLYCSYGFKAILDTKYIPKYAGQPLDTNVIRQLSGYSRDIPILRKLGYSDIEEDNPIPTVPCIIIYPEEGKGQKNPFMKCKLKDLCTNKVRRLSNFYKIAIPIPTLGY